MKKLPVYVLVFLCVLFSSVAWAGNNEVKTLFIESYLPGITYIHYEGSDELIGSAPLKIEKKSLTKFVIVIKNKDYDPLYIQLSPKEMGNIYIRATGDPEGRETEFRKYTSYPSQDIALVTSTFYAIKKSDKKNSNEYDYVTLDKPVNSIPRKSVIGQQGNKTTSMIDEGVAYDPVFGTSKAMRSDFCGAFYRAGIRISNCDNYNTPVQEKAHYRKYVSIKPTIAGFSFRIYPFTVKNDIGATAMYSLKMSYDITLAEGKKITKECVSNGYCSTADAKSLFSYALLNNVFVLMNDSMLYKDIHEANKVLSDQYRKDSLMVNYLKPSFTDSKDMIKKCMMAVVTIKADEETFGSGFVVHPDGYIMTNYHVIDEGKKITVNIGKDTTNFEAELIKYDAVYDLALLKINKTGMSYLSLTDSEKADIGENVIAIGTPARLELGQTVSKGIISGKREMEDQSYLQVDMPINPGNSGGPLINENGEVLGVVSMKIVGRGLEGLGFAIPSNKVIELMNIVYRR